MTAAIIGHAGAVLFDENEYICRLLGKNFKIPITNKFKSYVVN